MTLKSLTAMSVAAAILASTPAFAGPLRVVGPEILSPQSQVEQIRYIRHRRVNPFPAAIVSGVIAGIVGGAIGGGCYFNDCGYDYGYYNGGYYNGGYYGGGYGGYGGGRGHFVGGHGRGGHGGGHRWTPPSTSHK